jgi:riboflavin biosynthesis pyrimidine reductase
MRVLRAAADVVIVGGATARREDYGPIRVRDALASTRAADQTPAPVLAVVTLTGSIPDGLEPGKTLLVTTRQAPAAALAPQWGDSLIVAGDMVLSPRDALDALADRGFTRVLCEGGPALARLFLYADAVDDYCLTASPHAGPEGAPRVPAVPDAMRLAHTLESEGFLFRRWTYSPVDVTSG